MITSKLKNNQEFIILILQIVLFFLLEYLYLSFMAPLYSYRGFAIDPSLIRIICSKLLFFSAISLHYYMRKESFTYAISGVFIIFFLIPVLILYQFINSSPLIPFLSSTLVIMILGSSKIFPNLTIPKIKAKHKLGGLTLFSLILMAPFFATYGLQTLNLANLLFQDVYETRLNASQQSTIYTSYLYGGLAHFFLPLLLLFSKHKKKYFISILVIGLIIYLFLTHSHKMTLLCLLLTCFFSLFRTSFKTNLMIFLILIITLILSAIGLDTFLDYPVFKDVIIYRSFFVPALLNTFYFDFFNNNHIFWSNSILEGIVPYFFDLIPHNRIGLEYLGSSGNNAGNGLISDGYMHLGIIGIIFNSLLIILLFGLINALKVAPALFPILVIMIIGLIGGSPLSSFLTGGIGLFLLLLLFVFEAKDFETQT